jgi:hypothetical protein
VIQGAVIDTDRQPAKDFTLAVWPLGLDHGSEIPIVKTNQAGEYRFERLCPGRYTVLPDYEKLGYPAVSPNAYQFLYGLPVEEVKLIAENSLAELPVKLRPKPGRMHVHISDRATSAKILRFTIELKVPGRKRMGDILLLFEPTTSDDAIVVPPDKEFTIHVTAKGFHKWSGNSGDRRVFLVASGSWATLNAELDPVRYMKTEYGAICQVVLALGTVSLTVLALRGWAKGLRKDLPPWRNAIGIASVLLTFLTTITFLGPMISRLTGVDTPIESLETAIPALIVCGILSGCALTRAPRLQVIGANLLLVALWRASMVF